MRLIYEQVQKRVKAVNYDICTSMEKTSVTSWVKRFVQNAHIYGHQNGKSKPPIQALKRHFPKEFSQLGPWKTATKKFSLRLFCFSFFFSMSLTLNQPSWPEVFFRHVAKIVLLCQKSLYIESLAVVGLTYQCDLIHIPDL